MSGPMTIRNENERLRAELVGLEAHDREIRSRLVEEGALFGGYHLEMEAVHLANARRLDQILNEHGWPGSAVVGDDGAQAAWIIAMHAISDPPLQRKALELLSRAASDGDAPAWQAAYLTDRILFNQQRPQIYGTIRDWDENGELTARVEDADEADRRRAEIGMPPMNRDGSKIASAARSEGERPPTDLAAWRREQREWALRVGWIADPP